MIPSRNYHTREKMYNNKKIVATIEARMTSARLPGKVLKYFCGKPDLQHIIERLRRSKYIDDVVVATTINDEDEPVIELCKKLDCHFYRGSEDDVLKRVLDAAKEFDADIIVEITGDCPVIDWRHADYLIEQLFARECDYVANNIERSFPRGYDTQVFPTSVLERVNDITDDPIDHEHVSLYIYRHPEVFKIWNWHAPAHLDHPEYEATLDTIEDYNFICAIYNNLYEKNSDFTCEEVVELLLKRPDIAEINSQIKRKIVK